MPERAPEKLFDTRVYGYLNAFLNRVPPFNQEQPLAYDRATGEVIQVQAPMAFNVDAFLMVQGTIANRYRYFLNLAALGAGDAVESSAIELRNAWVEASLFGQALAIRAGRLYRRFGLYNELLDATPTFIGIKEPEILDEAHLMITRTTNLMLPGTYVNGSHKLEYSATTGNDERESNQVPLGADLHYSYEHTLKLGISYNDTMGKAKPGVRDFLAARRQPSEFDGIKLPSTSATRSARSAITAAFAAGSRRTALPRRRGRERPDQIAESKSRAFLLPSLLPPTTAALSARSTSLKPGTAARSLAVGRGNSRGCAAVPVSFAPDPVGVANLVSVRSRRATGDRGAAGGRRDPRGRARSNALRGANRRSAVAP